MTHPMDMSLSCTGWNVDPTLVEDISFELIHSDTTGDCFRIKLEFKNGTDALIDIEVKDGAGINAYDLLTEAIRTRRVQDTLKRQDDA